MSVISIRLVAFFVLVSVLLGHAVAVPAHTVRYGRHDLRGAANRASRPSAGRAHPAELARLVRRRAERVRTARALRMARAERQAAAGRTGY